MKKLILTLIAALGLALGAQASEDGIVWDKAPNKTNDLAALQNGAKLFVNYCLNCHGASAMRYNRLRDIGLSEEQIKQNLLFSADKVGDTMHIAMDREDAKKWFGAMPPDLSVIARARGSDWLYTYLRNFYRDENRPTGWNNTTFANVGMPHVLYELQGEQTAKHVKVADGHGGEKEVIQLELTKPGKMSKSEYDSMVGDLVAYLVYMGEPGAEKRRQTGLLVIIGLSVLLVLSYLLKREFWKDVH